MGEIISASHDVVFKALFVRNPDILRAFLRDILDLPITDSDKITILNPELIPDFSEGKLSRLDIHVDMKNRRFNIEMQARKMVFLRNESCIIGRNYMRKNLNPAGSTKI